MAASESNYVVAIAGEAEPLHLAVHDPGCLFLTDDPATRMAAAALQPELADRGDRGSAIYE